MNRKAFKHLQLAGTKEEREKFKIHLINDIKTFLFGKWEKPWQTIMYFSSKKKKPLTGFYNVSGRKYNKNSSINLVGVQGKSPFFITLASVRKQKGKILDPSKISFVMGFTPLEEVGDEWLIAPSFDDADVILPKPIDVINVDFVSGIKKPGYVETEFERKEKIEYVENFLEKVGAKKRLPKIHFDQRDACYYTYTPITFTVDRIHMVKADAFKTIEEFYSTLFHEIVHSTKNPSRTGRGKIKRADIDSYAAEELVAEMGAMMICTELGLKYQRQNSITYLKGWLQQGMKNGNTTQEDVLIEAFNYACDAVDFLLKDIDIEKLIPESVKSRIDQDVETVAEQLAGVKKKSQLGNNPKTNERFSQVKEISRDQITLRPDLFQGRLHAFAKETVEKIVNEGFDKSQEPIAVWFDPDTKKYVVISGHSRFEASRILYEKGDKSLAKMPVKIFQGDLDDAIDYAVLESNRSGTQEGVKSDIRAFKRAIEKGFNRQRLQAIFKPESYLNWLQSVVYLNQKGRFIEYLDTPEEKSFPYLRRNAEWVGTLRRIYRDRLTNQHENEIFDFIYRTDKGLKMIKNDLFRLIDKKVMTIDYDPGKPLALFHEKTEREPQTDAEKNLAELERKIAELNKERIHKEEMIATLKRKGDDESIKLIGKFQNRLKEINHGLKFRHEEKIKLESIINKAKNTDLPDLFSIPEPMAPKETPERKKEVILPLNEIEKLYGSDAKRLVKLYLEKDKTPINFPRLIGTTDKIIISGTNNKTEAIAEALHYEIAHSENFKSLTEAIERGGYEMNKDIVDRMIQVGINLPRTILAMKQSHENGKDKNGKSKHEKSIIFTQFKYQPQKAIRHLLKIKDGEAISALYRPDIGDIDIIWGENDPITNKGFGLKHIVEKHGAEIEKLGFKIESFIALVVEHGTINLQAGKKNRIALEGQNYRVIIELMYKGQNRNWLLTVFDLTKKPG